MCLLYIQNNVVTYLKFCINDSSWVWYLRFEYLSFGGLKLVNKKKMGERIVSIDHPHQLCEECLLG